MFHFCQTDCNYFSNLLIIHCKLYDCWYFLNAFYTKKSGAAALFPSIRSKQKEKRKSFPENSICSSNSWKESIAQLITVRIFFSLWNELKIPATSNIEPLRRQEKRECGTFPITAAPSAFAISLSHFLKISFKCQLNFIHAIGAPMIISTAFL